MRVWLLATAVLVFAGCARTPGRGGVVFSGAAADGWRALERGEHVVAEASFRRVLAGAPRDLAAAFGAASLAFERAEPTALEQHLALLGWAAVAETEAAPAVAAAVLARLPRLLDESVDPAPAFRRLSLLPAERLGWRARVALAELRIEWARHQGDPVLLEKEVARAGCLTSAQDLGRVARLPRLDLTTQVKASQAPSEVLARGCRLRLPALDGLSGVRAARFEITASAHEGREIVLDVGGPAAWRLDDGAWERHGGDQVYGPRRSARRVTLSPGRHLIEVRAGSFGGPVDLTLHALPVGPSELVPAGALPVPATLLIGALLAELSGDADAALAHVAQLERRPTFALGAAVAARLATRDPSRPSHLARDRARAGLRRALERDERLSRLWRELALLDLTGDRTREAVDNAEQALRFQPAFWPAALTLHDGLAERGFERQADEALDRALAIVEKGTGGCEVRERALRRTRQRHQLVDEQRLAQELSACDAQLEAPFESLRRREDRVGLEAALRRAAAVSVAPEWLESELAHLLLAHREAAGARQVLARLVSRTPRDAQLRLRLADAQRAAGDLGTARVTLKTALDLFPTQPDVRAAARAAGLSSTLESHRVDGRAALRTFRAAGRHAPAPAVLVLDRTVHRVFPDGAQMILTHNIVQVATKDGMDRWGEIAIPDGAEVLTLRTHKPDGSTREPEDIAGKATISAPDLQPGDAIEWETLEFREPSAAFAPGFLGERFYFQSVEAPLDRSEYLVIVPAGTRLSEDRRAGAPAAQVTDGPEQTRVFSYAASNMAQLFAERAAPSAIDWIPSVRVSRGLSLAHWSRYLADELFGVARLTPTIRDVAARIAKQAGGEDRAAAIVRWVEQNIEPGGELVEAASLTLARGRGNRTALILALARALDVPVKLAFVRSRLVAAPDAPVRPEELDDFSDVLLRFEGGRKGPRWVDPRLRHAPFGYIPPMLHGAPSFLVGAQTLEPARSTVSDRRQVSVAARIDATGAAKVEVTETLQGWPALEWAEFSRQVGRDRARLRRDFEQRWLSQHFPGGQLGEVAIDVLPEGKGARLRYNLSHPQLAIVRGGELRVRPNFFESQPGRRYTGEASRRTPLIVGPEVTVELDARLEFPPGSQVLSAGDEGRVRAGPDGTLQHHEGRSIEKVEAGRGPRVIVSRRTELPLLRVEPSAYGAVATALRRVDPLERAEIRVRLPSTATPPSTSGPTSR